MTKEELIAAAEASLDACQAAHDAVEATADPHPQVLELLATAVNIAYAELQEEISSEPAR